MKKYVWGIIPMIVFLLAACAGGAKTADKSAAGSDGITLDQTLNLPLP